MSLKAKYMHTLALKEGNSSGTKGKDHNEEDENNYTNSGRNTRDDKLKNPNL